MTLALNDCIRIYNSFKVISVHSTIYYLNIKLSGTLTLHLFLEGGQEGYPYRPKSSSLGRLKGNIFFRDTI